MKVLSCALLLMASMAFVLFGCSDNSNSLVTPNDQAIAPSTSHAVLAKMGEGIHSATGTGHAWYIWDRSPALCSFSAILHADGRCSGEIQDIDKGQPFYFHGKVYDLRVEENRARVSWKCTRGSWPAYGAPDMTGWLGMMVVVDNGKGNGATEHDLMSMIWLDPPGTYYGELTPPMTIEQIFAMEIDDYLNYIHSNFGLSYSEFMGESVPGIWQIEVR
jgi:hypothetical protein